jgi:hypothetical protein
LRNARSPPPPKIMISKGLSIVTLYVVIPRPK